MHVWMSGLCYNVLPVHGIRNLIDSPNIALGLNQQNSVPEAYTIRGAEICVRLD